MRQTLVMANWKMHGSPASIEQLLGAVQAGLGDGQAEIAVCPTHIHLAQVVGLCAGSRISVGAQDCSHMQSGAYTGEVSAQMQRELGCKWVLIGHSERRQYHAESDELLAAKMTAAVEAGLSPVLCVGETHQERENGEAELVVRNQLKGALEYQASFEGLVIAYEPVWAIGTGLTASPEQAQHMHAFIRSTLQDMNTIVAQDIRLLYGGSVKPGNAEELFAQQDIDGALVGGASLVAEDFLAITDAAGQ
jgi:triosephosphate isomerase (TIM)